MARLVLKNGHEKDTCCDEIGFCAQNIDTILRSVVYTFGMGGHIVSLEELENLHFDLF